MEKALPSIYRFYVSATLVSATLFLIAAIALALLDVSLAWLPVLRWSLVGAGWLGIFAFIAIYTTLKKFNRPVAGLALALGGVAFFTYSLSNAARIIAGIRILPSGTIVIIDAFAATAILLFGALAMRVSKSFFVLSIIAAALVFVTSPLGAFVFTASYWHAILLGALGSWCLKCVRMRFLFRERERIRK